MLAGKTIVVSGAASGIGAATARVLKKQGASVIGIDLNPVGNHIDRSIQADLSDPRSIDQAVHEIGGGIDALCNIAGLPPTATREAVLKVNFLGLKYLTESLIDQFNDGASIVNMASLAGSGWPQSVPAIKDFLAAANFENVSEYCDRYQVEGARSYFFSKELLVVWTMLNRWAWRERGIRMNCISPGPVDTPILPDFIKSLGERAEEDMRIMDRPGTPKDIAPVVAFLCSDESAWFRGANLPADGGMYQHIMVGMHGLEN